MLKTNDVTEHDMGMVKNLNQQETDQLDIYKRDQAELNSGVPRTTWPPATSSAFVPCDLNMGSLLYILIMNMLDMNKFLSL